MAFRESQTPIIFKIRETKCLKSDRKQNQNYLINTTEPPKKMRFNLVKLLQISIDHGVDKMFHTVIFEIIWLFFSFFLHFLRIHYSANERSFPPLK